MMPPHVQSMILNQRNDTARQAAEQTEMLRAAYFIGLQQKNLEPEAALAFAHKAVQVWNDREERKSAWETILPTNPDHK